MPSLARALARSNCSQIRSLTAHSVAFVRASEELKTGVSFDGGKRRGNRQKVEQKRRKKSEKTKNAFTLLSLLPNSLSPPSVPLSLRSSLCMLLARTGAARARTSTLTDAAKTMLLQGGLASRNVAFSSERAAVAALSSSTCPPSSAAFLRSSPSASCSGRRAMVTCPTSFAASATAARRKNGKASAAAAEIDAPAAASGVVS